MTELAQQPLVQKYALGFQKVRTHDKPGAKCRVQVQQGWGGGYPAEVEGSDPGDWPRPARSHTKWMEPSAVWSAT
jgi:hypothetical protein